VPDPATADLVERLVRAVRRGEHITLLVGSGVTAPAVPDVVAMLALADDYAAGRDDRGDLTQALEQARAASNDPRSVYLGYRRAFASWVSGNEFDVVAQEAVLQAYQPADRSRSALATHGVWQRVDARLGERVEADLGSWRLPDGAAALGRLLAGRPAQFGNRLLTTNFDPLAEIAVRRAGGRATPLTLSEEGVTPPSALAADAVRVFHLHGYWRPVRPADRRGLLHDPEKLLRNRRAHAAGIARLLRGDTICVVGYGAPDEAFLDALRQVGHRVSLAWTLPATDEPTAARHRDHLESVAGSQPDPLVYPGVDSNELFPRLAERIGVPAQPRTVRTRRRFRQRGWEREILTEPTAVPPPGALELIAQLDRRFGWEFSTVDDAPGDGPVGAGVAAGSAPGRSTVGRSTAGRGIAGRVTAGGDSGLERWFGPGEDAVEIQPPSLLFWPVRLRDTSSLIHAVQALVAAALSARGVEVVACLDDFGLAHRYRLTGRFTGDVRRWFGRIAGARPPTIVSLQEYVEQADVFAAMPDPAMMLRPTRPWAVARELYGERNPSLYSVLVATKILPNIPVEQLADSGAAVVQALLSKNANRLLTPLTLWAYLNSLLIDRPTASVVTLGGHDEHPFWQLWREVFDYGVNQLYNPQAESLTNESLMLRWRDPRDLADHLLLARSLPDWDTERRYLHWLVQNALLLPVYLTGAPVPMAGPFRLDSWDAVLAAVRADPAHLATIAHHVSELYLPTEG
jgi:hypothetical protein